MLTRFDLAELCIHLRLSSGGQQLGSDLSGVARVDGDGLLLRGTFKTELAEVHAAWTQVERQQNPPFAGQRDFLIVRVIGCHINALREGPVVLRRAHDNSELLSGARLDRAVGPTVEPGSSPTSRFNLQGPWSFIPDQECTLDLLAVPDRLHLDVPLFADETWRWPIVHGPGSSTTGAFWPPNRLSRATCSDLFECLGILNTGNNWRPC